MEYPADVTEFFDVGEKINNPTYLVTRIEELRIVLEYTEKRVFFPPKQYLKILKNYDHRLRRLLKIKKLLYH